MKRVLKRITERINYMIKAGEIEKRNENLQEQIEVLQEENTALEKKLSENQKLEKQASDLKYFVDDVLPKTYTFPNAERVCMLCLKVLQKEPVDNKKDNDKPVKLTVAK